MTHPAAPDVRIARRPAVDPVRWPDVARPPRVSPVRTAVARRLVRAALDRLPLRVRLGDEALGRGGPLLDVRDPDAFFRRIGAHGLIGFGESYMAGEWDTGTAQDAQDAQDSEDAEDAAADGLTAVLTVLAGNAATLVPAPLQRLRGLWAARHPVEQRNTRAGAERNISHHYDLSNDLFALFLDETMTYSSALFRALPADRDRLPDAQRRKIDRLLDLAGVGEGTRLLEIGTGWGELALRAAARGARVHTVTLSREQRDLAAARIAAAGLADRVSVELRDYRALDGSYDAIVSVEMIEAVGAEFWPDYLRALDRLLLPGGTAALQAITMAHDRMLATKDTRTWIHKYVFPGGLIPSVEAVDRTAREHTSLLLTGDEGFGPHYAQTLRLWREEFTRRAAEVAALGFDDVFRRLWTFYLAYSEAGFACGYLDVRHLVLSKPATPQEGGTP